MTALEIKNDLLKLIGETDDTEVLGQVRDFFQDLRDTDIPDEPNMPIEEVDRLLLKSETDKRISYGDFFKKYKSQ